ncbi:prestin-like isoform X2 [Mya arenaria]|uniref:prestin-like isoform X2 n=1 Tax=Mya arenaria TaxID=6604 RepID=UPI0022E4A6FB|nr:prestin-like isoform X2 [Mya arenaria]
MVKNAHEFSQQAAIEMEEIGLAQAQEEVDKLIQQQEQNGRPKILVDRSAFSQKNFDENFEAGQRPSPTVRQVVRKKLSKCMCSGDCIKQFFLGLFPFIHIMKNYNIRENITGDIVSGLTVGIMHIPQGMAYGMLTTLPPVYGLYMSFFPVLLYFLFGSSKHVSMGTFAVACLMVGSAVTKGYNSVPHVARVAHLTVNDTNGSASGIESEEGAMSQDELDIRLQFAMSVTFMVGVVQLLMGVFRLGFITVYLSDPLISGFTTGAACHVFTSQIKHIFAIKTARYAGAFKLIYTYKEFFMRLGDTNYVTVIISVICIAILYSVSRFINQNPKLKPKMFMPVPIELIVVVLGTVISYAIKLETAHNVPVVSDIPTGLPVPNLAPFSRLSSVISDAIALAIVIFAISISMGKLLAKKHDYEVDANQELVAYGISTIVSSFLSSCAPSASLSRSLVQERVGGKTQVAGLVSCVLLLVVLLAIGPYFRTLPNCVLASIIINALRGMFLQVLDLKKLWSVSLIDFFVWIVAFLATVVLDVDLGLGVAVIFNILTVVCRSQQPYATMLGQLPGTDIYRDMNIYVKAKELPGVKIFRFEHSLFFVNTEHFRTMLYKRTINPRVLKIAQKKRQSKLAKANKRKEKEDKDPEVAIGESLPDQALPLDTFDMELQATKNEMTISVVDHTVKETPPDVDFHTIILDCSPWSFVDSMGVKVLTAIISEYKAVGVQVMLANCKGGIREMFVKTRFYDTLESSSIYVSLHDAVQHALHLDTPNQIQDEDDDDGTGSDGHHDDQDEADFNDIGYVDENIEDSGAKKLVKSS